MKRCVIAVACGMIAFTGASVAHAELLVPGLDRALTVVMKPAQPRPGDTVHLTAESALIDIPTSDIVWYRGGKQLVGGEGVASVDIVAGALGSKTDIKAAVTMADGAIASAQISIIPAEVNILYTTDSFTPPFYRGRALPSAGTVVRFLAVARLKRPTGGLVPDRDIVYTWRRDGQVLGGVSGRGRSSIEIPSPFPKSASVLSVDVRDESGTLGGSANVDVVAVKPVVRLYEDHPLFGIRYERALDTTTTISEKEMTFAAVPYFASARRAADNLLSYDWTVNDTPVQTSGGAKNELTLGGAREGTGSDRAHLTLSISHATNVFFDAAGAWNIVLGGTTDSQNVFRRSSQ